MIIILYIYSFYQEAELPDLLYPGPGCEDPSRNYRIAASIPTWSVAPTCAACLTHQVGKRAYLLKVKQKNLKKLNKPSGKTSAEQR